MDQKFLKLVAEVLKTESSKLHENSTPGTIPEWDSLNHWLLIGKLEEAYNLEFTMDEATEFKNLGEIYTLLTHKQS